MEKRTHCVFINLIYNFILSLSECELDAPCIEAVTLRTNPRKDEDEAGGAMGKAADTLRTKLETIVVGRNQLEDGGPGHLPRGPCRGRRLQRL